MVRCPVLAGCISQGDTRGEALANIQEAIALCAEELDDEEVSLLPLHFELVSVSC